jgi:hypothetical protein
VRLAKHSRSQHQWCEAYLLPDWQHRAPRHTVLGPYHSVGGTNGPLDAIVRPCNKIQALNEHLLRGTGWSGRNRHLTASVTGELSFR